MSKETQDIHVWHQCHGCGAQPIVGRRFHCTTCPEGPDADLCATCFAGFERGELPHPPEPQTASPKAGEHRFVEIAGEDPRCFEPWLTIDQASAAAPEIPDGFVTKPEFRAGFSSIFGAYAFVARLDDGAGTVLLTALHIMDELVKKEGIDCRPENASYTGRELPEVITKVQLYDPFATHWMIAELGTAGPMWVLPRARLYEEEPFSSRDIAAFWLSEQDGLVARPLAPEPPEVGEPLWLAVRYSENPKQRALQAVVVERSEQTLIFRFADPSITERYTSGAPLVDRRGAAVGINIGGGRLAGGKLGHGNHVGSLRKHLQEGAALSPRSA